MEKNMHTPGPWTVETRFHVHAIIDPNGQEITFQDTKPQADCGSITSRGRTAAETEANARLIAAAPELLKAFEECLGDLAHYAASHGPGPDRRFAEARRVIKKAGGNF